MIIDRGTLQPAEIFEHLTNEEVVKKTEEALADPTVESIETYKMGPRWERRKQERQANRRRGKRRSYR